MQPITFCTTTDRMQYELPHTSVPHEHRDPGADQHSGHGGMGHDMSDPTMAAAMERDMRNRFFIALAFTIPVILLSPLAVNSYGIELRPEWAALLMSVSSIIVATNAVLLKRVERDLPQRDGPSSERSPAPI